MGELATLPRAAVVVEDRYSQVFTLDRLRPATVADGLAELQIRYPAIPIMFCETRKLAEEWTYRYLAAARTWAETETAALQRIGLAAETHVPVPDANTTAAPSTAEIRVGPCRRDDRPRPRAAPPRDPPGLARRPPIMISASCLCRRSVYDDGQARSGIRELDVLLPSHHAAPGVPAA